MKENISYSIERGTRFLESSVLYYDFFVVQVCLPKKMIPNGILDITILDNKKILWDKKLDIDKDRKIMKTIGSHEDPLVLIGEDLLLCLHIDKDKSTLFSEDKIYTIEIKVKDKVIYRNLLENLSDNIHTFIGDYNSKKNGTTFETNTECRLTLHLGTNKETYNEKTFAIKNRDKIDISEYLGNYEYIGVQFSYENENPEIEEKYIIIGQKGVNYSGFNDTKDIVAIQNPYQYVKEFQSMIPNDNLQKIETLKDFYLVYENKKPYFYTFNYEINLDYYLNNVTYNQDGLYAIPLRKQLKAHFTGKICEDCEYKKICGQVIPSGLSYELYKENIRKEEKNDCLIFNLLK